MKKERDSQRARYYKAVSEAFVGQEMDLVNVRGVETFIRKKFPRAALAARYGAAADFATRLPVIKDGRGYSQAVCYPTHNEIHLPNGYRLDLTVLRHLTYILHTRVLRMGTGSRIDELRGSVSRHHNWQHCSILLDVLHFTMGKDVADTLIATFKKYGVRYTKPVTKTIDPSRKVAMQEQGRKLAAIRRDQLTRARFVKQYPDAVPNDEGKFDEHYETLYRVFR